MAPLNFSFIDVKKCLKKRKNFKNSHISACEKGFDLDLLS
jgi:hypothetical protein